VRTLSNPGKPKLPTRLTMQRFAKLRLNQAGVAVLVPSMGFYPGSRYPVTRRRRIWGGSRHRGGSPQDPPQACTEGNML
jgi:hypothetical protein